MIVFAVSVASSPNGSSDGAVVAGGVAGVIAGAGAAGVIACAGADPVSASASVVAIAILATPSAKRRNIGFSTIPGNGRVRQAPLPPIQSPPTNFNTAQRGRRAQFCYWRAAIEFSYKSRTIGHKNGRAGKPRFHQDERSRQRDRHRRSARCARRDRGSGSARGGAARALRSAYG